MTCVRVLNRPIASSSRTARPCWPPTDRSAILRVAAPGSSSARATSTRRRSIVLAAPRYQRRGLDRSLAIETFDRVFAREVERPRLWPLVHDERAGARGARYSAADAARVRHRPGGDDRRSGSRLLCAVGRRGHAQSPVCALRATTWRGRSINCGPLWAATMRARSRAARSEAGDDDLRAAAERLGPALLGRAHQAPDGSLRWPSSGGRADLYAGASGIGLFFAALAAVTGASPGRTRRGRRCGESTRTRSWRRIPSCGGSASAAAGRRWPTRPRSQDICSRTSAWSPEARELALAIPLEAIDSDDVLDIEGGAAGALVALLAVHEVSPDDRLIAMAGRCVSRLLATQIRTGPDRGAWPSGEDSRPRPGFAHGAAGIAYALCRWAAHAADRRRVRGRSRRVGLRAADLCRQRRRLASRSPRWRPPRDGGVVPRRSRDCAGPCGRHRRRWPTRTWPPRSMRP